MSESRQARRPGKLLRQYQTVVPEFSERDSLQLDDYLDRLRRSHQIASKAWQRNGRKSWQYRHLRRDHFVTCPSGCRLVLARGTPQEWLRAIRILRQLECRSCGGELGVAPPGMVATRKPIFVDLGYLHAM
jgi:hypothetical protein